MTIVCARINKGQVTISADSQITDLGTKYLHARNFSKLVDFGNFIIGFSGSSAIKHVLLDFQRDAKFKSRKLRNSHQVHKLLKPVFEAYKEEASSKITFNQKEEAGVALLVVGSGKIFRADEDSCEEFTEYAAIGAGESVALGALYAGADPPTAVEAAIEYAETCGGMVVIRQV
jgi:ATP-dependent protease HslVU (ClpYQ) peptidase subunit